jgi:hypothetical protein
VAAVQITARDDAGDTLRLRGKLGDSQSTGHYKPFEHALLDDLVTVHTGTDQFDHDEQDFPIAAITINLRPGGDWDVWYDLGSSYSANPSRQFQVAPVPAHNHPPNLCQPMSDAGDPTVLFRYTSLTDVMTAAPGPDAAWDAVAGTGTAEYELTETPTSTRNSAVQTTDRGDVIFGQFAFELDSDSAALIAAGGATILGQFRTHMRSGIGVDDGAQDGISQMGVRVTQGDSITIRGTALALHTLNTLSGSTPWQRSGTYRNASFPPAAATNVLTAVPGTVSGDFLLIEVGCQNLTPNPPAATGAHMWFNDLAGAVGDLPNDETTTTNLRSWIQITGEGTPGTGDGHADLIGTSNRASRCDHRHDVHRDRAPTISDDGSLGYNLGTIWAQLDDLENPTTIVGVWMLVDTTTGAAVWLPITSTGGGGTSLTIEEEDGSPTGTFEVLRVTNGTLTDNGDSSASLSLITDHGALTGLADNDHPQYALTTDGEQHVINVVAASGSTETLDLADGNVHDVTLTDDCTLTLAGATNGVECQMRILLRQGASPPHLVTWPGSVEWVGGVEPTLQTALNSWDWVSLVTLDGGTTWYGQHAGTSSGTSGSAVPPSILLESGHATPFTFDEILQESDGSDFLWASE